MTDPRYPIGTFTKPEHITAEDRARWIDEIAALPSQLRSAVTGLSDAQLDTPYREGGWTVQQVVHHVADSHLNSYMRFKLALTEDAPTIKPYDEASWAELPDSRAPVEVSLTLLNALHNRWILLLQIMTEADFARTFTNPESDRSLKLTTATALYAWHGKHHTAHITSLREQRGW